MKKIILCALLSLFAVLGLSTAIAACFGNGNTILRSELKGNSGRAYYVGHYPALHSPDESLATSSGDAGNSGDGARWSLGAVLNWERQEIVVNSPSGGPFFSARTVPVLTLLAFCREVRAGPDDA